MYLVNMPDNRTVTYYGNRARVGHFPLRMAYSVKSNGELGCADNVPYTCNEGYNPVPYKNPLSCAPTHKPRTCQPSYCDPTPYPGFGMSQPSYQEERRYEVVEPSCDEGYYAKAVKIGDFVLEAGRKISLDMKENGVVINNDGVNSISVAEVPSSGVIVSQSNGNRDPKYKIGLNYNDIIKNAGLITKIIKNGQEMPIQFVDGHGVVNLSDNTFGNISVIKTPNNTISITPGGIGVAQLDVKPLKVNGITVNPQADGTPFDLINGVNTIVEKTSDGKIKINVGNSLFVKSIRYKDQTFTPDTSGQITLATGQTSYQATTVLTEPQANALKGGGLALSGLTPSKGVLPGSYSSQDVVTVYLDSTFVIPTDFDLISGVLKFTNPNPVNGSKLTLIVHKVS